MKPRKPLRKSRRTVAIVGTLCLVAYSYDSAAVVLSDWATGATTAAYDCTGYAGIEVFCPVAPLSQVDGPVAGGVMQSVASSMLDDTLGNARAMAELAINSGIATPVLKAEAFSGSADGGAAAAAFAVEAYTNTSGSAHSYTLEFYLDAVVDDPTASDPIGLDQGTAVVGSGLVVKADSGLYAFSDDFETVVGELTAQSLINPEIISTDLTALTALANDGVTQNLMTSLSFDLNDGESVYFIAQLTAQAMRDESYADAFSTLTVDFRDTTGLVSQSNLETVGVPEPSPLHLIGLGAILILTARRVRARSDSISMRNQVRYLSISRFTQ